MNASPNPTDEEGKATVPDSAPSGSKPVAQNREDVLPDLDVFLKENRTLVSALKSYLKPYYSQIPVFAHGPTPEANKNRFERIFQPWPKWVFRIGAELLHVDYPTIDKDVFFQTFRAINFFLFRCPTDPKAVRFPGLKADILYRIDFEVFPMALASFWGHSVEHIKAYRKTLDDQLAAGKITKERYDEATKMASMDRLEKSVSECLAKLGNGDGRLFELIRRIDEARRQTYDRNGARKETPLIPAYRLLLANWITVESMSGPKELTHLLLPVLGGEDFYSAYDRVKQISFRLGIVFRPRVKEM